MKAAAPPPPRGVGGGGRAIKSASAPSGSARDRCVERLQLVCHSKHFWHECLPLPAITPLPANTPSAPQRRHVSWAAPLQPFL